MRNSRVTLYIKDEAVNLIQHIVILYFSTSAKIDYIQRKYNNDIFTKWRIFLFRKSSVNLRQLFLLIFFVALSFVVKKAGCPWYNNNPMILPGNNGSTTAAHRYRGHNF